MTRNGIKIEGGRLLSLAVLAVLYPVCLRYVRFKAGTRPDSLWRLF